MKIDMCKLTGFLLLGSLVVAMWSVIAVLVYSIVSDAGVFL